MSSPRADAAAGDDAGYGGPAEQYIPHGHDGVKTYFDGFNRLGTGAIAIDLGKSRAN